MTHHRLTSTVSSTFAILVHLCERRPHLRFSSTFDAATDAEVLPPGADANVTKNREEGQDSPMGMRNADGDEDRRGDGEASRALG